MLKPISQGDRGAAVEDVQKRLLMLGFDLGPTGIDGVFLGTTLAAVRQFQREHELSEDGTVGDETWSALVDATFRLGDRLLYLRIPYFHGADVAALQGALNVLGFACGPPDGIFGAFTERAVGEFQSNVGLPRDGIAGPETVRAIERLHHVWQGKDTAAPAALSAAPARAAEVLGKARLALVWQGPAARAIAERVANLASAAEPAAQVDVLAAEECVSAPSGSLTVRLCAGSEASPPEGMPVVSVHEEVGADGRFVAAFGALGERREVCVSIPDDVHADERSAQSVAVRILDGLCAVLSVIYGPVVR
ncbi:MAG TPA: peptidoglycan-binding protein [Coriobacteriia bacterium]|nr:MAG: Putative peptidoglycan-binding domain-containing protein [Actinobacteria bacterium 66_15]HAL29412.1 peptidoglycan-binding protein [Coriobacteriia bacterium]